MKDCELDELLSSEDVSEALEEVLTGLKQAANSMHGQAKSNLKTLLQQAFEKEPFENEWQNLKLILGAGGSGIDVYKIAAKTDLSIKNVVPVTGSLPLPGDFQLQGLPSNNFHRFAVAYGVSFSFVDLSEVATSRGVKPLKEKLNFEVKIRKPLNTK